MSLLLIAVLLSPLAGALLMGVTKKHIKYMQWLSPLISVISLAIFAILYMNGPEIAGISIDIGMPVPLRIQADILSVYMGLLSSFVWCLASLYSIEYIGERKTIFNVFLMFSLYGMLGIILSANIYTLLIFFELFSIASAILIIHDLSKKAIIAGFQYLFISVLGTVAIIIGAAFLFKDTGSLDLIGNGISGLRESGNAVVIFWLLIAGFAIKAGLFPVHVWLPEAHPIAPSSASALLSGVMIKAGAYGIIRVIYSVFGSDLLLSISLTNVLIGLALVTMIYGSVLAIMQTEFKRLLAYSSVAQIGYVVLGVSLLSETGLKAGVFHIFSHAFMKGALFLSAGTIIHQTGIKKIAELKGISKYMPVTMLIITLSALSMIGVPPFSGFLSKWVLAQGVLDAGSLGVISTQGAYIIIGVIVLSGLLNIAYFGPIIIMGWFNKPQLAMSGASHGHSRDEDEIKGQWLEPSWKMLLPAFILAAGTLVFGIFPSFPMGLSEAIARLYF